MTTISLEAKHISRAFGQVKAVNDVNLKLEAGQVTVLLGPSGSGKSTLLRMLAGLEGLDSGEIFARELLIANSARAAPTEDRGIGLVFQDYALFPHLTALENVAFGLNHLLKAERTKIGLDWLERLGLASRCGFYPHQLSGGEQQRVALARALAPKPSAVLMDEPFSGLDPHLRGELQRTMLSTLREAGVAALVVSHDAQEALAIGDQIAIMDVGRIIQSGTPHDVYSRPVSLQAAYALGAIWTYQAQATNGHVETPFGSYATTLLGNLVVAARPDATVLRADASGNFTVQDVRGVGRFVTVALGSDTCVVQAIAEAKCAPDVGDKMAVEIASADLMVFEA